MTTKNDLTCTTQADFAPRRSPFARVFNRVRAFGRDEDGAIMVLTLFFFLIMITAAGIAIDMMRYEMKRAQIQTTLDNAVLAAAGAPFGTDARAVIEDYFATADMTSYLNPEGQGDIQGSANASRVTASASMTMNTYLMKLSGVDTLSNYGSSSAERRVPKLEISLVLDVSGSMGSNNKLTNLKSAAKQFVSTILNGSEPGDTVISVVPFSWNVAPGEGIYNALSVNEAQDYSTCLRFSASDYTSAAINPATTYNQQIYTSVYGGFDSLSSGWRSCFNEDYAEILPYSMSIPDLNAKIDSMVASGNTSGHLGMKWGAALLDPAFSTVSASLRANLLMDASLTNVPSPYNESETLKVIVMMGDGKNTTSYFFDQLTTPGGDIITEASTFTDDEGVEQNVNVPAGDYRGPNSDLYRVDSQEMQFQYARHKYKDKISNDESKCGRRRWDCVYEATGPMESAYYLRDDNQYYSIQQNDWISASEFSDLQNAEGFVATDRLTWEEAWGRMSPDWYRNMTGNNAFSDYVGSQYDNGSTKNDRMADICSATKANNVVVYTIGFEISQGGTAETELKNCASSVAHYYRAEGVNINDAFSSIASNVINLRLTQ